MAREYPSEIPRFSKPRMFAKNKGNKHNSIHIRKKMLEYISSPSALLTMYSFNLAGPKSGALTWLAPVFLLKNSRLSADSSKPKLPIWSRDTAQRITCFANHLFFEVLA